MLIGLGIATVETVVSGEHRCSGFASPAICRVTGEGRVGSTEVLVAGVTARTCESCNIYICIRGSGQYPSTLVNKRFLQVHKYHREARLKS